MLPIKYIENNMIKNVCDEWFAYYRILPYDYSFLSEDEKSKYFSSIKSMIAGTQNSNLQFLMISTQRSIKRIQERSKEYISGKLRETALHILDMQTQTLTEGEVFGEVPKGVNEPFYSGETQLAYEYYIGLKLAPEREPVSFSAVTKELKYLFKDFTAGVNKSLMGDYLVVSDEEYERYSRFEGLLYSKIASLFPLERVGVQEIGYITEHLYGVEGVAFEDYCYYLPAERLEAASRLRNYNVLKLSATEIGEYPRHIIFKAKQEDVYCAYMTIKEITGDLQFPSSEILYYQQLRFDFPVDVSINVSVTDNKKAIPKVRGKKKQLDDMDNHLWKSGMESTADIDMALEQVSELEEKLINSKVNLYEVSYLVRVTAPNIDELERRITALEDFYRMWNIKLIRPIGDMVNLHNEFIPSAKRENTIIQYVESDFLACLGVGLSDVIGENDGIVIGHTKYSNRLVYLKPWLAAQGISGTVTNSLSAAFIGSLGGGKSMNNNLLVTLSVLFGARAVIIDPKSERGKWKEDLPFLADDINIVNFTANDENRGMLDPYVIMRTTKERESLALDVLTYLTGVTIKDDKKYPVLRKAVKKVGKSEKPGMLFVVDELRKEGTEISAHLADHIESFVDFGLAGLLFSNGEVNSTISFEKNLNILQIADLVLPDKETRSEDYTVTEMLSVAMMIVITTFCLNFITSDKTTFKICNLDEAWAILNVSQGKVLSNKLVRAGRAMNSGIYFVTQSAKDLSDESIKNNIGMFFIFRSNDIQEVKASLRLLGVDEESEENQKMIYSLKNGECVFKDIYGHVNVIMFDYLIPELFKAFDTRPIMGGEHEKKNS